MDNSSTPDLDDARQFQILVNGVVDYAIYMLSPTGEIVSWNPGGERIKGYQPEEVLGRHFSIFYTPEDVANGEPARALHVAATEGKYEHEGWRMRKNGTRFWASVVIDPIRDGDRLIGFAKVTRDMSERREANLALEQAREAFMQSQKAEAISRLTLGLAHDFNNLLTVIINSLDRILAAKGEMDRIGRLVDTAQRAADRGALLTKQLLAFSRGDLTRARQQDVNAVVRGCETLLRRACDATITLSIDLAASLPLIAFDATQFEAALLNLVINARDAMPDTGGHIDVTSRLRMQNGGARCLVVCVHDNGSGMPADVAAKALDPFFTTKQLGKGSGLGLSQVYGAVTNVGGSVKIESRPGVGTTVTMSFPVPETARPDRSDDMVKILMVDDEKQILELISETIADQGFDVVTASSGDEALEMIHADSSIDILFSDVMMPGLTGLELAKQAAQIRPDLKIVLASGHAESWIEGIPEDAQFISKPYRLGEMIEALSK